jgi:hypothetical protein
MNGTMRWVGVALLTLGAQVAAGAEAVESDAKATARAAPGVDMTETDMSHTGSTPKGTVTVPWNLLGGAVGDRTVSGVRVELYVLQAQEPDKLKPGDPNHAFTVALKDGKTGEFVDQGEVSIAVAGDAGADQRSPMPTRSRGIFRAGVALPQPGQYRVTIAFKAAGRAGQADFPYVYHPVAQATHTHH